jgi:hypothetical protein
MQWSDYKKKVFEYLSKSDYGKQTFASLLGTPDLLPKKVAIQFFIKALKEFEEDYNPGDKFLIELSSDGLGFIKRETSWPTYNKNKPLHKQCDWGDLDKLEKSLKSKKLKKRFYFDKCSSIGPEGYLEYIESHIHVLKHQKNEVYKPYYDRLIQLNNYL